MALWRGSQKILFLGIVLLCFVSVLPDVSAREHVDMQDLDSLEMGRHLLQTVKQCPIDFATKNYSSITNVCNASNPDKVLCCSAYENFTCPYVTYVNDLNTDCSTTLISYLTLAGNYPSALFADLCVGTQQGLPCPLVPAPSPLPNSAFFCRPWKTSILMMFLLSFYSFGLDFIV